MCIKNLSIIKFPRKAKKKKKITWNLYYHQDRRDQEILVSYLRKHCSYYCKTAKLESRHSYFKAWHSSLKFENYLCYLVLFFQFLSQQWDNNSVTFSTCWGIFLALCGNRWLSDMDRLI